jgi:hypothetical protein
MKQSWEIITIGDLCKVAGAVRLLNEVPFFNQTFVLVDCFVIRNRQPA